MICFCSASSSSFCLHSLVQSITHFSTLVFSVYASSCFPHQVLAPTTNTEDLNLAVELVAPFIPSWVVNVVVKSHFSLIYIWQSVSNALLLTVMHWSALVCCACILFVLSDWLCFPLINGKTELLITALCLILVTNAEREFWYNLQMLFVYAS